jgi:tetratricopeptide (TPR) repeat protein
MVFCILIQATAPASSEPLIVNYDHNPNLQKAMEYDLTLDNTVFLKPDGSLDAELYQSYVARASRDLAERHYLAYLEEVKEPFQRARVYAKLSDLYSGNVRQEVAPHPTAQDMEKALEYCRKALAEAPDAVSLATIHIRGKATMLPDQEKGFRALEDHYQWLLSLNEQQIVDRWLPLRPGDAKPGPAVVDNLVKFLGTHTDTVAYNLVDIAVNLGRAKMRTPGPKGQPQEYDSSYLLEIIERFPGTRAQEYARQAIGKLMRIVTDKPLTHMLDAQKEDETAAQKTAIDDDASPSKNGTEETIPIPIASAPNSDGAGRGSLAPGVIIIGVLVLTVVIFGGAKGLQRMKQLKTF